MTNTAGMDDNMRRSLSALSSANDGAIVNLWADPITHRLLVDSASGSGTVTSVSVVTNQGVSGSVATPTTTPAITLTLGALTGVTSFNGLVVTANSGVITTGTWNGTVIIGTYGGTGVNNGTKTLTYLKNISFTAADDTGVYTLPTGTKTLLATDGAGTSLTGIPYTLTGTANQVTLSAGTGNITFSLPQSIATSSNPQFATIELGAATDTTISRVSAGVIAVEGVTVDTISAANTLTNKTLTSPILTTPALGTPSSGVLTSCTGLPAASVVAGTLGTGAYVMDTKLTVPQVINTANAITASANAATVPVTQRHNIVTNNSAATLTITMTTTSAVNMQVVIVQILDFSAAAQTITWVNTENSTVSAPITSNGSTSSPLTVGFIYNSSSSKWRCIASA